MPKSGTLLASGGGEVQIVAMLTPSHAVDLFLGDLSRRSRSQTGATEKEYRRLLTLFVDSLQRDRDVTEITPDDCRRWLNTYARRATNYQASIYATLNSFLEWLYLQQRIKRNPLDHVARPRRIAAEDLDVTTIETLDVPRLLAAARGDSERLAVALPAYLGPRRAAIARARLRDYDRDNQLIRFGEKGTKAISKPVPVELAAIIEAAIARGSIREPDDYLVPPEGPLSRKGERDDRCIWRLVKKVAARAGVDAHVHALRAAFATFYLEQNPNDIVGLQELLGHRSIETTKVYLRKLDKRRSMEPVRTLSWANVAPVLESGEPNGFVYVIAAGDYQVDGAPIKIGWTGGEPVSRLGQLQKGHHEPLTLLAAWPGTRTDEARAHMLFEADRMRGEWFRSTPALREAVANLGAEHIVEKSLFAFAHFGSSPVVGAGGFEPPSDDFLEAIRPGTKHRAAP